MKFEHDYVNEGCEPDDVQDEPTVEDLQEVVGLFNDEIAKYRYLIKNCVLFSGDAFGYEITKDITGRWYYRKGSGEWTRTGDIIQTLDDLDLKAKADCAHAELIQEMDGYGLTNAGYLSGAMKADAE